LKGETVGTGVVTVAGSIATGVSDCADNCGTETSMKTESRNAVFMK
jgi:hypothetical protein